MLNTTCSAKHLLQADSISPAAWPQSSVCYHRTAHLPNGLAHLCSVLIECRFASVWRAVLFNVHADGRI
jgi:hypothetical protein